MIYVFNCIDNYDPEDDYRLELKRCNCSFEVRADSYLDAVSIFIDKYGFSFPCPPCGVTISITERAA